MANPVFTIGHSNHPTEMLIENLQVHQIDVVLDVRSFPYSRYSPQFNREALARACRGAVRYAWLGAELGGRPEEPAFYDELGHALYGPLSRSPRFIAGIESVERNARRYRLALLCSEADPTVCHRFLLVTRSLRERGMPADQLQHVLGDGTIRTEAQLAIQVPMLEDAWRSPLSVSPERALNPSLIA